ncbi:MAG: undecaprenyl-phosphate glucose phosphotransferase [Alphaproteobacteria bacterium]|nr:undecaprenyl-phosphate glucose phosphotransferase [Alphaproteobacteria bacterium]
MTSETTSTNFGFNESSRWKSLSGGTGTASKSSLIERAFCDRVGQIRRPMLLLGVVCTDALLIAAAGVAATTMSGVAAHLPDLTMAILVAPWLVIAALSANWSYSVAALRRPAAQVGKIMTAATTVMLMANGAMLLAGIATVPPAIAITWWTTTLLALALARICAARLVESYAKAGRLRRRAVIVGGGEEARTLCSLLADESMHLDLLGTFDDRASVRDHDQPGPDGLRRLCSFAELSSFCRETGVELLIVSVPEASEKRLLQILARLFTLPVDIRISAHNNRLRFDRAAYRYIGKVPMLPILDRPLSDADRMIKNVEDRLIGLGLLLLAAPVMALVALAVKLESRGPVLFRQKRLGFNNEPIEVLKFRSMYTDMSDARADKLVTRCDPRVTRIGRIIRKTSLDELPQLFNVLRGDMSIVGPRPHALAAKAGDALYHDAVRSYFARHKVKPGITGWAQVNGWRGETDTLEKIERRVEHDMHYINNWSVLFDLYIIAMTPISLIGGKNAY